MSWTLTLWVALNIPTLDNNWDQMKKKGPQIMFHHLVSCIRLLYSTWLTVDIHFPLPTLMECPKTHHKGSLEIINTRPMLPWVRKFWRQSSLGALSHHDAGREREGKKEQWFGRSILGEASLSERFACFVESLWKVIWFSFPAPFP